MRFAIFALGRNLAAGLRLALFMPIERVAFRISAVQLLLVVVLSAAIDIDADWVRAAHEARFSLLGLHGELFALGLLALTSAILAVLRRDGELYVALPVVLLASFPVIQIVHVLPDLPGAGAAVSPGTRAILEYAVVAWMLAVTIRAVYVCSDPRRSRRRLFAFAGGLLVIAPFWFAPLLGPLDPWWREHDAASAGADTISPASEAVLAAQEFMMGRALDSLEDERPAFADLYFVGFAPDARRAGFVADVDAAQRAMDERWNTHGRSVVLVNSPLTVAERPFATVTHLRKILLEIGEMIDADEDIVMVYLTGSSEVDHGLTAINPPLELVALSPQGLKQLFDAAGIRWRIVVVSTCYAGAWVDALKDDETVVIASSPSDTRDPACGGGVGATPFGSAFFDKGIRSSGDLAQAFDVARKELAVRGSAHPVLSLGSAITERLKARAGRTKPQVTADVR